MVQVIRAVVESEEEETFVHLVYGCRTQDDILMKRELDHFSSYWNFTVLYLLSRTNQASLASSPGSIKYADKVHFGRIDAKLVEREMPRPQTGSGRSIVLICGTRSFDDDMMQYLTHMEYTSDMYFKY
jgi:cytochrome-b5 reductase